MALDDSQLADIRKTVGALVDRRQPPVEIQDQLRIDYEVDGHRVRIFTLRPRFRQPDEIIKSYVAQFAYTRSRDAWKLYWMRADMKWHAWREGENQGPLRYLVEVVDRDRDGGFWG